MKRLDLTGQRFTRLLVVERDMTRAHDGTVIYWFCRCDCGKTVSVERRHLRSGRTQSCGCLSAEKARARHLTHGMSKTSPEYSVWCKAKARCHDPRDQSYARYGGRGITMCPEWREDFPAFFAHIGSRPSDRYSIDRIDNDRGYEPGNVRWATRKEQSSNRRMCIYVQWEGENITLSEYARRTNQSYPMLLKATRKGHDPMTYARQRVRK